MQSRDIEIQASPFTPTLYPLSTLIAPIRAIKTGKFIDSREFASAARIAKSTSREYRAKSIRNINRSIGFLRFMQN